MIRKQAGCTYLNLRLRLDSIPKLLEICAKNLNRQIYELRKFLALNQAISGNFKIRLIPLHLFFYRSMQIAPRLFDSLLGFALRTD